MNNIIEEWKIIASYLDMVESVFRQRQEYEGAINAIIEKNGGIPTLLSDPAADPEKLKKQGGLFGEV